MGIFRSYFDRQAGLIKDSLANTSRNEVMELAYGIINNNYLSAGSGETVYTRYVFRPNMDLLKEYIDNSVIPAPTIHTLRMYNTINLDEGLRGKLILDDSRRTYGFTLNLYRLDESFSEGIGHDYRYTNTQSNEVTRYLNERNDVSPNWFYRNNIDLWAYEGAISHTGNTLIATQYFELGTENIEMNITDEVSLLLNNSIPNNGYCITFSTDFEEFIDDRLNKVHFFSRHTQTWFEPHIESTFNDLVLDTNPTSDSIALDDDNRLYIYSKCVPTGGTLYDHCGDAISSYTGFTMATENIYYVDLGVLDSATYPSLVNFEFSYGCSGNTNPCAVQLTTFKYDCKSNTESILQNNEFNISLNGLNQNERIKRGFIRKIDVKLSNFNNIKGYVPLEYRIFALQGKNEIEVQGWANVSRFDGKYFIKLYTAYMIPKEYYLEFKVKEGYYEYSNAFRYRFFIISEKIDGYR